MKNRLLKIALLISLTIFNSNIFSQGGSGYSRYGLGDITFDNSVRKFGLGGLGIGAYDINDLSMINPASNSSLKITKITGAMRFDGINTSDALNSKFYSNYYLSSVSIGIPVSPDNGAALIFSMHPYSKVNYNIVKKEKSFDGSSFSVKYTGNGGLTAFSIGGSYRFPFGGSAGLSFNYLVGTIKYESQVTFDDLSYLSTNFNDQFKYKGTNFNLGLISPDLKGVFNSSIINDLRVGMTFSTSSKLNTELAALKTSVYTDTMNLKSFDTELPSRIGLGFSCNLFGKYNIFLDYLNQNFSNFKRDNLTDKNLQNLQFFNASLELLPPVSPESFIQTLSYRFGVGYKISEFNVNSKSINELIFSLGLTVPFDALNSLDFGFQYGIRGTTESQLQKDNIFRFVVGLNFSEHWFMRDDD